MKITRLVAALVMFVVGGGFALAGQQIVQADVATGDRPVLVPIDPCRLVDTRPSFQVGTRGTPLGRAETLVVDARGGGTGCSGRIPSSALGLSVNVTAPSSSGESFVTLWSDGERPNTSTLNPQPDQLVFNAATVDLDDRNAFRVYNDANRVHVIIDVTGYYENHSHDDRYYTRAEVDAALAGQNESVDTYTRSEIDEALAVLRDRITTLESDRPAIVGGLLNSTVILDPSLPSSDIVSAEFTPPTRGSVTVWFVAETTFSVTSEANDHIDCQILHHLENGSTANVSARVENHGTASRGSISGVRIFPVNGDVSSTYRVSCLGSTGSFVVDAEIAVLFTPDPPR